MTSSASPSRLAMELEPSLITCLVTDCAALGGYVGAEHAASRAPSPRRNRVNDHRKGYHGHTGPAVSLTLAQWPVRPSTATVTAHGTPTAGEYPTRCAATCGCSGRFSAR